MSNSNLCSECKSVLEDKNFCISCGWVDQEGLKKERVEAYKKLKKLSKEERFKLMFRKK